MFRSARFQLMIWYAFTIMMVSVLFSLIIYRGASQEIDRFSQSQRTRIQRQLRESELLPAEIRKNIVIPVPLLADPDLAEETKVRFAVLLIILNSSIVFLATIFGYLLAGKTLGPIQTMMSEQHRFISDASHELRTPLTALKASLEVGLRDAKLSASEARTLLEESLTDVHKLQKLSDNLLHLAQYRKPTTIEQFSAVSIESLIKQAVKAVSGLAKKKHISIERMVDPGTIWGQAESLHELLVIILDNAIKYSPAETKITCSTKSSRSKLIITISDQGEGIAQVDLPHVFDRFYRADAARQHDTADGYGLGLAIAKEIVSRHGGTITAESNLGTGTSIRITLPGYKLVKSHA